MSTDYLQLGPPTFDSVMADLLADPELLYQVATHLRSVKAVSPWEEATGCLLDITDHTPPSGDDMISTANEPPVDFWDRNTTGGRIVARVEPRRDGWRWVVFSQNDQDWFTGRRVVQTETCPTPGGARAECDAYLASEEGGSWLTGTVPNNGSEPSTTEESTS